MDGQAACYGPAPGSFHTFLLERMLRSHPARVCNSPECPFEHLTWCHLPGVVVVAVEELPEEGLVHGQLAGLAAVPGLGARLRDQLARAPVRAQLVVLNAPGEPARGALSAAALPTLSTDTRTEETPSIPAPPAQSGGSK